MSEYHWPDREAVELLNAMLDLPIEGYEQDWEVEFADLDRVPEWLQILRDGHLGLELRSALALLVTHSLFEPNEPGFA